jgi:hypothetical protein
VPVRAAKKQLLWRSYFIRAWLVEAEKQFYEAGQKPYQIDPKVVLNKSYCIQ